MAIIALDQQTVKFLTTAQVVTSVSTAVKELVENAIDADSNSVDIRLDNNGASLIEVSDNGKGIAEIDTPFMALQCYTSKIKQFCDLDALESYGFRGEALSSLCAVAEVTVITRTDQDDAARLYRMNHDGSIKSSELSHRSRGTTVQAKSMFKDLPVRRQIMTGGRRSSQDIKTLENLLRSFAISHPRIRISLRVNGNVIFAKPSTETARENLTYVLGKGFVSQIDFVENKSPEFDVILTIPSRDATELLEICLSGRYVFVNKRPVFYKEIEKAVSQRVIEYFGEKIPAKKKPGFIVSLTVPPAEVDVNLEPNKTSVLLTNQAKIVQKLDKILVEFYGIASSTEDRPVDQSARENDSTTEYHDFTSSEVQTPELADVPSAKKRKIEDKTGRTIARGSSAVNGVAASGAEEKTPMNLVRTAKKLFETRAGKCNETNKENHFSNSTASKKSPEGFPAQVTSETISQLPVVDLGEDFSAQEILNLPNLDPAQVELALRNSGNENFGLSTTGSRNAEVVTEEAWSKGQAPMNLHGGTDVHIYNHAANDSTSEIETTVADVNSIACKGFSKFSKETRPQIIRENPGINFVETAKMLTARWKELCPEERGYYRDLAVTDKAQQRNHDASVGSTKSRKQRVNSEDAESNRKRFLDMLDKMKHAKSGTKGNNLMMRTVVPWTLDLDTVTNSFIGERSNVNSRKKSIVLGGLNDNVWLVRTGFQIWALSLSELCDGLSLEKTEGNEKARDAIEELVARSLREKRSLSFLHPVFELG